MQAQYSYFVIILGKSLLENRVKRGMLADMKPILLEEVYSPACRVCDEFEAFWKTAAGDFPNVEFKRLSILDADGQDAIRKHMIFSSPGILINGDLFSSGGFDKEQLTARLKELS